MRPKISIIVPVYNTEKYLNRCIESILSQTFSDFELLLINDGSTDKSGMICEQYATKDSRVKVYHKENGGVSSARNIGLFNAEGEWIAYVDGDDWIEPTMYEELYNIVLNTKADIVYSDFKMVFKDKEEYYSTAKYASDKIEMMKNYITSVWTCLVYMLVRRDLYFKNNLQSPVHLSYCEDFWLSVRLFHFAKHISYVNKAFYNYNRTNEVSRVNNLNKKTELDEQIAYLETIIFFSEQGCINNYVREMSWRILKSKQELILDRDRHIEFLNIYPISHIYIWTCPYINKKIKFMMWLLVKKMDKILNLIIKMRTFLGR